MVKKGVSRFCVEYFLSHSIETFHRGTLLCFRNLLKFFLHITILSIISCLTVSKWIIEEHFCASGNSRLLKILWIRWNIMVLFQYLFCRTVPKRFVGAFFSVSEFFWFLKNFCIKRGYHNFALSNFCLTVAKHFVD